MRSIRPDYFDGVLMRRSILLVVAALTALLASGAQAFGQGKDDPVYSTYRGVKIGSTMSEVHKTLGDPKEKADGQDFYQFGEKETATIVYGDDKKVNTISVDFLGEEGNPPTPMQVIGTAIQAKPDGSSNLMVRYPKAGYWVCYSKTAGQSPIISVTMQKLQ